MTPASKQPRRIRTILSKGKQWIERLMKRDAPPEGNPHDADSASAPYRGATPGPAPLRVHPNPPTPSGSGPVQEGFWSPGAGSTLPHRNLGIQVQLRDLIGEGILMRKSVEAEMLELGETYQALVPPCRLQLLPWVYAKGNPPQALYWVRWERRKTYFDHQTMLPRPPRHPPWCKVLKIRNRKDLSSEIHWVGMDKHRKQILSVFARAQALNRAHRAIAWQMKGTKRSLESRRAQSISKERIPPELTLDPFLKYYQGKGVEMLFLPWTLERAIEEDLVALEVFKKSTEGLRFRLTGLPGLGGATTGQEWEDTLTGQSYPKLDRYVLKKLGLSPEETAALKSWRTNASSWAEP